MKFVEYLKVGLFGALVDRRQGQMNSVTGSGSGTNVLSRSRISMGRR
jgi:hypothetical protein